MTYVVSILASTKGFWQAARGKAFTGNHANTSSLLVGKTANRAAGLRGYRIKPPFQPKTTGKLAFLVQNLKFEWKNCNKNNSAKKIKQVIIRNMSIKSQ
ncbi:MAG: hypothetical protein VB091_09105 [Christensenella sp.]|nr:hypothetical protein [Christensenella sp.]